MVEQSWEANLLELEVKLARSKAPWKIVVGHHPGRHTYIDLPTSRRAMTVPTLIHRSGCSDLLGSSGMQLEAFNSQDMSTVGEHKPCMLNLLLDCGQLAAVL